ncbi:MAG: SDR family NAD(P)-dependent oxidoreductase [Flavobacteriaceae bacterium]
MIKTAFITGASSGIGHATAIALDRAGFQLVLCGRREERLKELQVELTHPSTFLVFDVSDHEGVKEKVCSLSAAFRQIDLLVNNAGNAHGLDPAQTASIADWDAMIDSNVKGLFYVTKEVLPLMPKKNGALIINMGSTAAKMGYTNGAAYCASKAAVDKFTEGLRLDLLADQIRVAAIHPGLVHTEFSEVRFKGDSERAAKVYEGANPLYAEDIAEVIAFMATRPTHVNLADVVVMPASQGNASTVLRS